MAESYKALTASYIKVSDFLLADSRLVYIWFLIFCILETDGVNTGLVDAVEIGTIALCDVACRTRVDIAHKNWRATDAGC